MNESACVIGQAVTDLKIDSVRVESRQPRKDDVARRSPDRPSSVRSGLNPSRRPTVKISSEYAIAEQQHSGCFEAGAGRGEPFTAIRSVSDPECRPIDPIDPPQR
jgi:hypothetical protein